MALKRRVASAGGGDQGGGKVELCDWGEAYPDLWEFATLDRWPDGSARQLGTMLLCVEGGMVKLWLNDKDGGLSCWVSGDSVSSVFKRADVVCGGGEGDWRVPRQPSGKRK